VHCSHSFPRMVLTRVVESFLLVLIMVELILMLMNWKLASSPSCFSLLTSSCISNLWSWTMREEMLNIVAVKCLILISLLLGFSNLANYWYWQVRLRHTSVLRMEIWQFHKLLQFLQLNNSLISSYILNCN